MKNWIGKALFGIGVLHTIIGLVVILPLVSEELIADGIFNAVNGQPKREAFLWFLFSGFLLILLGALVNFMETNQQEIPTFLAWSLLAMTVFMLLLSPLSGGWLILVPTIALIRRAKYK